MKKKIVEKTAIFIVVLAYIFLFKFLFGDENILIGVCSITGLLMYMGRDLTAKPIRNTLGFILINLMIGIGSFITIENMWIGIFVNLIVVFVLGYTFCHTLKMPMYLPFILCYLFLLSEPVSLDKMPLRLMALVFGALSIMLPQFLIHKNKDKSIDGFIREKVVGLTLERISLIKAEKEIFENEKALKSLVINIGKMIDERREEKFYLLERSRDSLDLLSSLEKLNSNIKKLNVKDDCKFLNSIEEILKTVSLSKVEYKKSSPLDMIEGIKGEYCDSINPIYLMAIGNLEYIIHKLNVLNGLAKREESIKKETVVECKGIKNIRFKSIKASYAARIAICVTIACFIVQFFKLEEGKWIMFTVLSLTSPIFETTKSKLKDRIIATLIGVIGVSILFTLVKDQMGRTLLIMLAGYLSSYTKTYRGNMIFVTFSAVGAGSIMGSVKEMGFDRIVFILIGAFISIIINTFVFKYDAKKANERLVFIGNRLIDGAVCNLDKVISTNMKDYVKNVYIATSQINEVIKSNNSLKNLKEEESSLKIDKILSIYELSKLSEIYEMTDKGHEEIKSIVYSEGKNVDSLLEKIENLNDRIIGSLLIEMKFS